MTLLLKAALSPGHGAHDKGAQGFGLTEAALNYDLAQRVHLLAAHVDWLNTLLLRGPDEDPYFATRNANARRWGADVVLSIHHDSSVNPRNDFAAVFHYQTNHTIIPAAECLAEAMPEELQSTRVIPVAVKDHNYPHAGYVTASFSPPTMLLETCFLSNAANAEFIRRGSNRQRVAVQIVDGLKCARDIYGQETSP